MIWHEFEIIQKIPNKSVKHRGVPPSGEGVEMALPSRESHLFFLLQKMSGFNFYSDSFYMSCNILEAILC